MNDNGHLVSWKRIARYLDRGERTVRRWAKQDGMPVHHVSDSPNSSVFAFTTEIDSWLQQRQLQRTQKGVSSRPVLALLPIENLGNLESMEAIVDGLTEETISVLGGLTETLLNRSGIWIVLLILLAIATLYFVGSVLL